MPYATVPSGRPNWSTTATNTDVNITTTGAMLIDPRVIDFKGKCVLTKCPFHSVCAEVKDCLFQGD